MLEACPRSSKLTIATMKATGQDFPLGGLKGVNLHPEISHATIGEVDVGQRNGAIPLQLLNVPRSQMQDEIVKEDTL